MTVKLEAMERALDALEVVAIKYNECDHSTYREQIDELWRELGVAIDVAHKSVKGAHDEMFVANATANLECGIRQDKKWCGDPGCITHGCYVPLEAKSQKSDAEGEQHD